MNGWSTRVAWLGLAVYVACVDAWLIRHRHQTMSSLARTHPVATAMIAGGLTVHLLTSCRFDPLTYLGRRLSPGETD